MKKRSKKGFTLAELLIVIAIIAVLVAIMFPVFGAQLNKARGAADLANVRAKYSELVADAMLSNDTVETGKVTIAESDLKGAMQYATAATNPTVLTITPGTGGTTVKVSIGSTFEGSFVTDPDVTITTATTAP